MKNIYYPIYSLFNPHIQLKLYLFRYRKYYRNDPYFSILPTFFNSKKTALDIGANRGMFTAYLLKHFSHVIAFEPNPEMVNSLKRYFYKQQLSVVKCAVGNEDRKARLYIPIINGQEQTGWAKVDGEKFPNKASIRTVDVELKKLDNFSYNDIGFIKIDVEGYELEVLKGARETLIENKPVLFIEIEDRHIQAGHFKNVDTYLANLGYQGHFLRDKKFFSTNEFNTAELQKSEYADVNGCQNQYINNFIYVYKN